MATINGTDRLIVQPGNENHGPYIDLPADYAPAVLRLLDEHGVRHWLEDMFVSIDGKPFIRTINFSRNSSASDVQVVLDAVDTLTPGGSL